MYFCTNKNARISGKAIKIVAVPVIADEYASKFLTPAFSDSGTPVILLINCRGSWFLPGVQYASLKRIEV